MGILSLYEKSIKNIRKYPTYNPFNRSFNRRLIIQIMDECREIIHSKGEMIREEDLKHSKLLSDLCESTIMMNNVFIESYKTMQNLIINSNLSQEELLLFLFTTVNRDYQLITNESLSAIEKNSNSKQTEDRVFTFSSMFVPEIKSPDESVGYMNPIGAIEASVDCLDVLYNYLQYFEGSKIEEDVLKNELHSVNTIISLYQNANYLTTIKCDYEDAVWNDGYMILNEDAKELHFDFFSHSDLKIECVGQQIMHQRLFDKFVTAMSIPDNKYQKYTRSKRLKRCIVENGYLKYVLSDGIDKEELSHRTTRIAAINAYYEFLQNVSFPSYPELTIEKTLIMFDAVSYLFYKAPSLDIDKTTIDEKTGFYNYPFRIGKYDLKRYLLAKTTFNSREIGSFLSLLEHKGKFLNLWDTPLVPFDKDYLFALLPLTFPSTYNIIDNWLQLGGVSLDERGTRFEKYIKNKILARDPSCSFPYRIIKQSSFEGMNGDKEEIDLLIQLRDVLLVGEVKCIKYPMEVRDYHNTHKRLKYGCSQIVRKTEFLMRNHKVLKDIVGEYKNKKIIKVVITNYPLFSGQKHLGVPINDAHSFESYFSSGVIFAKSAGQEKGVYDNEVVGGVPLYVTEDEFNNNLDDYINNPPLVDMIMSNTSTNRLKRTPAGSNFNVYTTFAEIKGG